MSALLYDPGWLRHRVTVESAAGAADGAGGEADVVWDTVATLWANVAPVSAREEIVGGHFTGTVTHEISFRWRADLTGGMRVTFRGRTFRILAVYDPDETRRYVVAKATEEAP